MNEVEEALEQLELIDKNRRQYDSVSHDGKERMKEKIEIVCEKLYDDNDTITLREFLKPLDLHFDPEEFIEQDNILIPPKVISITIYLDTIGILDAYTKENIFDIYIKPYTKITQDEYFMVEEYIYRYH
jgi:hypothetical protein